MTMGIAPETSNAEGVVLMEDMATGVSLTVHDGVATVRYDQPNSPVNTLNTRVGPVFEQIFARIE